VDEQACTLVWNLIGVSPAAFQLWGDSIKSLLLKDLETHKSCGNSIVGIKCVFFFTTFVRKSWIFDFLTHENGDRWVVPKRRQGITTIRCVISQKSVDLNSIPQYEKTTKSKIFRYGLIDLNTSHAFTDWDRGLGPCHHSFHPASRCLWKLSSSAAWHCIVW